MCVIRGREGSSAGAKALECAGRRSEWYVQGEALVSLMIFPSSGSARNLRRIVVLCGMLIWGVAGVDRLVVMAGKSRVVHSGVVPLLSDLMVPAAL